MRPLPDLETGECTNGHVHDCVRIHVKPLAAHTRRLLVFRTSVEIRWRRVLPAYERSMDRAAAVARCGERRWNVRETGMIDARC